MERTAITKIRLTFVVVGIAVSFGAIARADGLSAQQSDAPPDIQNSPDFLRDWFLMANSTQSEQPHWITPVVTITPRLEQEFRFDMFRQSQPDNTIQDNFGGSKGLEIIPERHIELLVNLPPYVTHNGGSVPDGYGDVSFLAKLRMASANEDNGNYIVTFFFGGSVPTGSYTNGTRAGTLSPTFAAGKGWGNFDVETNFGAVLPTSRTSIVGRQIIWSSTLQYRLWRRIWPEVETNATFYSDGTYDGKTQNFVTPGFVLGKFLFWHRVGLTVGTGVQIATTRFFTYNHRWILSVRFPF